jgi:hypothetical protein
MQTHATTFRFRGPVVFCPRNRRTVLESSTNFANWTGLVTFPTNLNGPIQHTDSAFTQPGVRFYRARPWVGDRFLSGDPHQTSAGDVIIQPRTHATFVMQWNGLMI